LTPTGLLMEGVYAQNPGSGSMSDMAMLRHSVCDERPVPNARTGRTDSCRTLFSTSKIGLGNNPLLFTGLTLTFLKQFGVGVWLTLPLLSSLALGIILLGQAVGKKEGWPRFDSLYWSFITATTVGYGDIRPTKRRSRIIAILIAFLGLLLSGIIIAVAVQAATVALQTSGARP